jgi:hypothetical protein
LIERNAELEYMIDKDIKTKLEEGFSEVRAEIKSLKRLNKQF